LNVHSHSTLGAARLITTYWAGSGRIVGDSESSSVLGGSPS